MSDFRVYNAHALVVNIAGMPFTDGWGPNDTIAITEIGDGVTESEGIGHEVSLSISGGHKRAEIKLTLAQTTPNNAILTGLYEAFQSGGSQTFPVVIADPNGTTNVTAAKAYVQKFADISFGKNADGTRVWTIRTGKCASYVVGGANEI